MLSAQQIILMAAQLVGGLALFLYGMNVLSSYLTQFSGGKMESMIGKATGNRYVGWLFGTGVTSIVQSSSATTVMVVGLVNSGIMKLEQTVGLILGANLGTTATAWILSLNGLQGESALLSLLKPSTIMPFVALAGVALLMFARSNRKKLVGFILIGFGTMMIGMSMMSSAVAPLKDVPGFEDGLIHFSMPLLGFLFAIFFTMIIQSSDATIGILQALAISVSVNFRMAVVIVCGAQIGTCITAILSSVGSGKNAKRAALIHLYYNLIKNVPFITVLLILDSVTTLPFMSSTISTAGIALFHSSINLLFSLILLPVSGFLVKLAVKTIPYTEQEKQEQSDTLQYLDPLLFRNPGLAVAQARKAVSAVSGSVRESYRAWLNEDSGAAAQYRERSARYLRQTETYMRELTEKRLLEDVSKEIRYLQQICGDFSIINDQVTQLLQIREASSAFSKATADDLKLCGEAVRETLDIVAEGFETRSGQLADTVREFREVVSGLFHQINIRQINRIHSGESGSETGTPFTETCFAYELIMDRCDRIAGNLLACDSLSPVVSRDQQDPAAREKRHQQIRSLFRDKFSLLNQNDGE